MTPAECVRECAAKMGFARVGIASAEPLPRGEYVERWLAEGRHGEMHYLSRWHPARMDPRTLLPGSCSVIVVADNYRQDPEGESGRVGEGEIRGRIAQYACGRDYHRVLRKKLKRLVAALRDELGAPFEYRICVDTAPLLERELAMLAGIGWIGKNTMVLHQDTGSYFFLGEIVTTLELERSVPATDHCGTCTRCLQACPTGALTPYQMDAARCISYLTIEHRSGITPELRPLIGEWLYGCDICQEVCPFNTKAPLSNEAAYAVAAEHALLPHPRIDQILALRPDDYAGAFQGSAIKRATLPMLKRNAAIVAENLSARMREKNKK